MELAWSVLGIQRVFLKLILFLGNLQAYLEFFYIYFEIFMCRWLAHVKLALNKYSIPWRSTLHLFTLTFILLYCTTIATLCNNILTILHMCALFVQVVFFALLSFHHPILAIEFLFFLALQIIVIQILFYFSSDFYIQVLYL